MIQYASCSITDTGRAGARGEATIEGAESGWIEGEYYDNVDGCRSGETLKLG